jgi:hypothetical protein
MQKRWMRRRAGLALALLAFTGMTAAGAAAVGGVPNARHLFRSG